MFDVLADEIAATRMFVAKGDIVQGTYRWTYGQAEPYNDLRELTAALGRAAARAASGDPAAAAYFNKIMRHLTRTADQAAAEEFYVARRLAAWGEAAGAAVDVPLAMAVREEVRDVPGLWGPVRHTTYDRRTGALTFENDPTSALWAGELVPATRPYAVAARRAALARHHVASAEDAQAVGVANPDFTFIIVQSAGAGAHAQGVSTQSASTQSASTGAVMFGTPAGAPRDAIAIAGHIQVALGGFNVFSRGAIIAALRPLTSGYLWLEDTTPRRGHTAALWDALVAMVI